jgi:hypothetical protein
MGQKNINKFCVTFTKVFYGFREKRAVTDKDAVY